MARKKLLISEEQRLAAEVQLKELQNQIDYDTKDFTIELLVQKFDRNDFFIPPYQRKFIWKDRNRSLFIESVLLGLPIPFMFLGNCEDGKMEIIDGAQRMQTLVGFVKNNITLTGLKKLTELNNFKFSDLSTARQRKLMNHTLRIIVLEEITPADVRQDLFNRINTSGIKATDSEIRRGSYPGPLTVFVEECTKNELFLELCPLSDKSEARYERFELVLRFFAYLDRYESFDHSVNIFLDDYLVDNLVSFDKEKLEFEFLSMLQFVKRHFPYGFAKTATSRTTPRVRFEAISVGVALALRQKPDLTIANVDWLNSYEFKEHTTSDASNNQGKLIKRVQYVRDQLLRG